MPIVLRAFRRYRRDVVVFLTKFDVFLTTFGGV